MNDVGSRGRLISHDPVLEKRWAGSGLIAFGLLYLIIYGGSLVEVLQVMIGVSVVAAICRFSIKDIADEVADFGDHLMVRRGKIAERVGLDEIVEVYTGGKKSILKLRLSRQTRLGNRIDFYYNGHVTSPSTIARRVREHSAYRGAGGHGA